MAKEPYHVLVSEIMLQQTQAGPRTIKKYRAFIKAFPNTKTLARATIADVYCLWQGLGYNRRAKALRDAAVLIESNFEGVFPKTIEELQTLPGVGLYTAAAVYVFAYDKPAVLLETNIRTVFIQHLFKDREGISDAELLPYIEASMAEKHPRDWHYALMDYGAALKKKYGNANRRSLHYVRQSVFAGSARELRGKLLKILLKTPDQTLARLIKNLKEKPERVRAQLEVLIREEFVSKAKGGSRYRLL